MSENTISKYPIRPLTRKDRKTVTGLFKKVITESRDEAIAKLISSEAKQAEEGDKDAEESWAEAIANLGVDILHKGLEFLDDDIGAWFADLLNVSMEEFDKLPADIEIDILKQIKERPESAAFFTRAWQSAKVMKLLEGGLQLVKDQFSSTSVSEKKSTTDTTTEQSQDLPKTLPSSE